MTDTPPPRRLADLRKLALNARPLSQLEATLAPALLVGQLAEPQARWTFRTAGKGVSVPVARLQSGTLLTRDMLWWPVQRARRSILGRQVITVGRATSNDVVLDDASVSKVHARLLHTPDGWTVTDADSSNGTQVNQVALAKGQAHMLAHEDQVVFGTVALRFFLTGVLLTLLAKPNGPFEP